MRFLRYLVLFCIAVISGTVSAQSQRELGQLMHGRGEYYFTLSVDNPADIQSISKICSIDGTDGRTVVAYANQQEYNRLLQEGYQPNLQTPPSMREEAVMWQGGDRATYEWNSYLTYGDYVSMMEGFPSSVTNGASCTLLDLGTLSTTNHRRILGVRLNNGQPNGKPKFLYTSTMHGDEVTGMILMLRLINEFCTSSDSRIANILENVDLFIFPCTNPDGTYNGGNNTVSGAKRYNGNNVDLNRHFPDFDDGAHPDGASYYQDEAQWMMDLAQEFLFTMGANYHGGAEVMNYPWDTYQPVHPDDAWWRYVSLEYVSNARANNSSYMTDTESNGITNGYAWYTITGSRQDYMNYYGQCREITIECSSVKTPSASQLPNYWNYNHTAMLAYIEQCLNGVHGYVYDAVTLLPIEGASVTVENHDALGSSVTSHAIGDFHRPIKGGTYTFTFAKQGYYPESVQVTVADDNVQNLTIYLNPNLNLTPEFAASTTNVALGQSISFTDASEGLVSSWSWTFEGATPSSSTEQNPTGIVYNTPGDYDVTLTITGPTGNTQTVTKENYIHVSESILVGDGDTETQEYLPSYNYYNYSLTEQIYTPDDLGEGGVITSIAFYNGGATKTRTYDFYMKNTTKNTFTGAADWITVSDSDKVFSGSVIMTANDWTVINFTTPFVYDGVSNVVLVADDNTGEYTNSPHMSCRVFSGESQALYAYNDNTNFNPLSPPTSSSSNNAVMGVKNQLLITKDPFPTTPFNITVSANPSRAGLASGDGEYIFGETCTVVATPNDGYTFMNWSENGVVVSEDMEYSFAVFSDRDLVANFSFSTAVSGNCYYPVITMSAGSYVMGNLNGETLAMVSQNNTSVTATTATVTLTDYGFSVDEGTTLSQVTLQAYGNNGQYYIKYGNYYLVRSSSNYGGNSSLAWSTNSSSSGRWYINANGIYVAVTSGWGGSATNYYLYYSNGSFQLSTTQYNNIVFYTEGECPVAQYAINAIAEPTEGGMVEGVDVYFEGETCTLTATANEGFTFINWTEGGEEVSTDAVYSFEVTTERELVANFGVSAGEQIVTLTQGWSWWSTNLDITMEELENAIAAVVGTSGTATIKSKSGSITYANGRWRESGATTMTLDIRQMYKIQTNTACQITLTGVPVDPAAYEITVNPGNNWIGFPCGESMSVTEAFSGLNPVDGDVIKGMNGNARYSNGNWRLQGLSILEPGQGYIYQSNATESKTFTFSSSEN